MDRSVRLLEGVDVENETGLEIGPLDKPLIARTGRRPIYYADYASQDALRTKSSNDPNVDIANIPSIDFVVRPPLPESLGVQFDYIVASHVAEHVPDLLGWLETLFRWLTPNGRVVLAIPDKRYCFDFLRPTSTVGELLEAYQLKRSAPTFASVYNAFRDAIRFDVQRGWREEPYQGPFERMFTRELAVSLAHSLLRGEYHDCHSWVFTYSSFLTAIREIDELGVLPLEVVRHSAPVTDSNEFHVVLAPRRSPLGGPPST